MSFVAQVITLASSSLQAMVPLSLTATGETFNEKAGSFNIGLEGTMLLSAFTSVAGAEVSRNWLVGLVVGMLTGMLVSFVFAVIAIYWKGDQMITGVGVNLFALGFVAFGLIAVWRTPGHHGLPGWYPPRIPTPIGALSPLVLFAIAMAIITYLLLNKTVFGLRVKASGENPESVDVAGLKVERIRLVAALFGGALAGIAGAYISIDWLSFITKEISAGRGFISLACVVFSGLNPLLAFGGAFLFGFSEAFAIYLASVPGGLQIAGVPIPYFFIYMIPYIVTLAVVSGVIGRRRFPAAIGTPYRRE